MDQITKEYLLTLLAFLILPGGTISSLVFFRPAGMPWETFNGIMAVLGILLTMAIGLFLLNKRNKSINNRMRINFQ